MIHSIGLSFQQNKDLVRLFLSIILFIACKNDRLPQDIKPSEDNGRIIVGAERVAEYIDDLAFKNVGVVVNHSSMVGDRHLVDMLTTIGVKVDKIFAPEHGFRGEADAGEKVDDSVDSKTGIPVISLYGKKKKPSKEDFAGLDVIVFDIQDVGARFYTYISTLHYIMETAAETNVQVMVMDRPNPNGSYVDGPILEEAFKSYVGMHPVPVVYGMTIGEYARMINGEGWLDEGIQCRLKIMTILNYDHQSQYILPIKPSPNLPNALSIANYPSLCFFEGTTMSIGRGTDNPFQLIGHPKLIDMPFTFTPVSMPGAKYPKHLLTPCYGLDLSGKTPKPGQLDLSYLLYFYDLSKEEKFQYFNDDLFFDLLAGTDQLKKMVMEGKTETEIRASWQEGLDDFKTTREKYLIYN
ncbi:DUF1343 domain-containing protein [Saprospiraceae bacterium]|nr:DUF1343 domain-containing protein [Saprospiraceae bacterium]